MRLALARSRSSGAALPIALVVLSSFKPADDIFAVPPQPGVHADARPTIALLWDERARSSSARLANSAIVTAAATALYDRDLGRRRLRASPVTGRASSNGSAFALAADAHAAADHRHRAAVPARERVRPERHACAAGAAVCCILRQPGHVDHARVHRPDFRASWTRRRPRRRRGAADLRAGDPPASAYRAWSRWRSSSWCSPGTSSFSR